MRKTILICGLGRSGTNILLDSLGLSQFTHCRNEPHIYPDSPFKRLIVDQPEITSRTQLSSYWNEATDWMESRWGNWDRIPPKAEQKIYFQNWAWKLGIPQVVIKKQKLRQALSALIPSLGGVEFQTPSWLLTKAWQSQTVNVFKIMNLTEAIMPWLLANNPDIRVVLIIRHPLGYAQSLYRRLYQNKNESKLNFFREANIRKVKNRFKIAEENNIQFPSLNFDDLTLFESVIWNWLTFNELAYQFYRSQEAVHIVSYEGILSNPVMNLERVFDHVSLPWNDNIRAVIADLYSESAHLGFSFQSYWSQAQIEQVDQILQFTQVKELWTDQLWQKIEQLSKLQSGQLTYDPFK